MHAALIQKVSAKYEKKNVPELRSGDVVRVHQKVSESGKERIQIFEGIVLRVRGGKGMDGTFTVRRVAGGIGIERTFSRHQPSISKIEKTKRIQIRQSRAYYLRNLTSRQIKKASQGELAEFATWEDTSAADEAERIKAEQAAEAEAREAAKAAEEAEDAAKVEAAKAKHAEVEQAGDEKVEAKADEQPGEKNDN